MLHRRLSTWTLLLLLWWVWPAQAISTLTTRGLTIAKLTNIDGKTTATTTIFTNAEYDQFMAIAIVVQGEDISGFTSGPTISFGVGATNAATVAATAITISTATGYTVLIPKAAATASGPIGGASGDVTVTVTIAAVATTYKFKVYVYGFVGVQAAE